MFNLANFHLSLPQSDFTEELLRGKYFQEGQFMAQWIHLEVGSVSCLFCLMGMSESHIC